MNSKAAPKSGTSTNTTSKLPSSVKSNATDPNNSQFKETKEAFLKKLSFCSQQLDFNDDKKNEKEKLERIHILQKLQEMTNSPAQFNSLILPNLEAVITMIKKNFFRPLPIVKKQVISADTGNEEEEVIVDPSWPHFLPVYEFFLQIIINESIDVKLLRSLISQKFIQEYLGLFDSEEPKEREYLKNILHRLYAKLVPRRKMIRKAITDIFNSLIHETYKFNGASELLDILASVISGFAMPLREEHIQFFHSIIIPLHKVQTCHRFHSELFRCSMLFLSKDPKLAQPMINGLLKYWPFGNFAKESLFLAELLDILEVCCDMHKLEPLLQKLFKRIVKCIASPHLQVADRSMCFFENDHFLKLFKTYKTISFPIIVPVINRLASTHWHKLILDSLNALKNIIIEIDKELYEKCANDKESKHLYLIKDIQTNLEERQEMERKWKIIEEMALKNKPDLNIPIAPYNPNHVVGQHNSLMNGNILYID